MTFYSSPEEKCCTPSLTSLAATPVHAGCVASACPPESWLSVPPASGPDLPASHNNFATRAQNDGGWREEDGVGRSTLIGKYAGTLVSGTYLLCSATRVWYFLFTLWSC